MYYNVIGMHVLAYCVYTLQYMYCNVVIGIHVISVLCLLYMYCNFIGIYVHVISIHMYTYPYTCNLHIHIPIHMYTFPYTYTHCICVHTCILLLNVQCCLYTTHIVQYTCLYWNMACHSIHVYTYYIIIK